MAELHDFLGTLPLLADVPERALDLVAEACQPWSYKAGENLFLEGDEGDALYIIRSGAIKISKIDFDGHEKILAIFKAPEFFGEMALLSEEGKRSATASALLSSQIYKLYKPDFQNLIAQYPGISLKLGSTLANRLNSTSEESQILSYKDAQSRVAHVLIKLYQSGMVSFNEEGKAQVMLTQQDVGNLAGTSRETVTRVLKSLEKEGLIKTRPKIAILDAEGLEALFYGLRD